MKITECHTFEEWEKIHDEERRKHPIRCFLQDSWWACSRTYKSIKWWIRHRTTDRFHIVNTKLPPGYYDVDHRILYVVFSLLEDFMEKETPGEIICWDSDDEHKHAWAEMSYLYDWWKNIRPNRIDPFKNAKPKIDRWMEDEEYTKSILASAKLESEWYEEDTANMVRLCKIRSFLWT